MNPHSLPSGVRFWTSDPFLAMRAAAKRGLRVSRYCSGQYSLGMTMTSGSTFFGYGVLTDNDGFLPLHWSTE